MTTKTIDEIEDIWNKEIDEWLKNTTFGNNSPQPHGFTHFEDLIHAIGGKPITDDTLYCNCEKRESKNIIKNFIKKDDIFYVHKCC